MPILIIRLSAASIVMTLISGACAVPAPTPAPVPVPARIVTSEGTPASVADVAARASAAQVIFFGERHGDSATHRIEAELLAEMARTGHDVVVSLEMFERDAQPALDSYLRGELTEEAFLARARPWPRYARDYRALVEAARAHGWPVVAANVPRPMAAAVGRRGLAALDTLSAAERAFTAGDIQCPDDAYRQRFLAEMRAHPTGGPAPGASDTLPTAVAERLYLAQCLKDETMAESIVAALTRWPDAVVVHYTGAFHSDFGQGTVSGVRRRLPAVRIVTVTSVSGSTAAGRSGEEPRRADYLVVTGRD